MPTMSTVAFQSPSLPTISHLPVTVMGALASLVELLAPEVLAAGLVVVAGLLLAVLDGVFSDLLPQDITVAARATATARTNTGDFIDCLLMILMGCSVIDVVCLT